MKKFFIPILLALVSIKATAQESNRVITTGVPFLLIAADARAGGMGDMGVATSADAFSQQWNPSKYAFAISKQGIGITYTPYLSNLVNDIFLGNLTYYNRINEQSAVAASLRYFSLGDIELRDTFDQEPLIQSPNEFTVDVSYALRLSERFSMAVTGRYLRSDLKIQASNEDASAAGSFGVDVSGYYQSTEENYGTFNGRYRLGFNIANIGPKVSYLPGKEDFIPTNLKFGGGFDFILDDYNIVSANIEFTKLLVPTPPIRDAAGNIVEGKDDDVSFVSGIFQSFGDAPGGFSEEIKEFTYAIGAEYLYNNAFALRAGYFHESEIKGNRQFFTLGAGFKTNALNIDLSYLLNASDVNNPLENSLRFSLSFDLGEIYEDY